MLTSGSRSHPVRVGVMTVMTLLFIWGGLHLGLSELKHWSREVSEMDAEMEWAERARERELGKRLV